MTHWIMAFGWNWLLVPLCVWTVRGLFRALLQPRVKYVDHTQLPNAVLFRVIRQELIFPWRRLEETWLLQDKCAIRENDGKTQWSSDADSGIYDALMGHLHVARAKESELEILSKAEKT